MTSDEATIKPLSTSDLAKPSRGFTLYCEQELERRRNKGEDFDEEAFRAAVDLTIAKLQMLEDEEEA
ncbi:MAG: hypothetical protein PVG66_14270 [Chromatiales bacterium]|jgi:hypothetical protein